MDLLESHVGIKSIKEAIQDYKDLFLAPIKSRANDSGMQHDRSSQLHKQETVMIFRAETQEKVETADFKKFTNQITAAYFDQIQAIFSKGDTDSLHFRNCLAKFDQDACALDLVCVYKYKFDKAGPAASSLVVAKQSSKSHLIHQEVHTYWAPEFRQRALLICEKAITFFVSL